MINYKDIKSYLTLKLMGEYFRDEVTGKMVNLYSDCYGELWMKDSRWALYRLKKGERLLQGLIDHSQTLSFKDLDIHDHN